MDITKRFDRILKLFFLLQSKSVVSMEEMQKRFSTSERTLYRDLKALEAAGVPVINEAGSGYSIMEGFRIQPSRFSQEEMVSLVVAEKMMQKHETGFIKQHFDAALIKIKSSFRFHQKSDSLLLEDKLQFGKNGNEKNYLPNVLDVMVNAILKKKIAIIHYLKSDDDSASPRRVEPIGVFYESSNWYVLAYCHLRNDYRNFRLDRIKKIILSDDDFTRAHLPIDELRKKTDGGEATHIVISIDKKGAQSLYWDRNMFGFEKEETEGDKVVMHFCCRYHTTYFARWFLMFADMGDIIEPKHLHEELAGLLIAGIDRIKKRAF